MNSSTLKNSIAFKYFKELYRQHKNVEAARDQYKGITFWKPEHTQDLKKSDTLYVLGAGPSVNWLTADDWKVVAAADSIGTNWFLCHPFTPTYYQVEFWEIYVKQWLSYYDNKHSGQKPPVIINFPHAQEAKILDDLMVRPDSHQQYFTYPVRYKGTEKSKLKPLFKFHGQMNRHLGLGSLIHHGGSLSAAVSFGLLAGYKKIVLIGVDLNITGHFYDDKALYTDPVYEEIRYLRDQMRIRDMALAGLKPTDEVLHAPADPRLTQAYNENSVIDVVDALQVWAATVGARIEIANASSTLAQLLPVSESVRVVQPAKA